MAPRNSSKAQRSLFDKIRARAIAAGQSERTATQKAKILAAAAPSRLFRLSPEKNVKAGFSAKAERYALQGSRVTSTTATMSKRQFLERQTAAREGFKAPVSLEKAARQRRGGGLGYSSAATEKQAAKQIEIRERQRLQRKIEKTEYVRDNRGDLYRPELMRRDDNYLKLRERKLNGEMLGNEWFALIQMAETIGDPRLADLRRSALVVVKE
jgi:hypothetical protein